MKIKMFLAAVLALAGMAAVPSNAEARCGLGIRALRSCRANVVAIHAQPVFAVVNHRAAIVVDHSPAIIVRNNFVASRIVQSFTTLDVINPVQQVVVAGGGYAGDALAQELRAIREEKLALRNQGGCDEKIAAAVNLMRQEMKATVQALVQELKK